MLITLHERATCLERGTTTRYLCSSNLDVILPPPPQNNPLPRTTLPTSCFLTNPSIPLPTVLNTDDHTMAKVAANSLPWLSDPSAGYHLFQSSSAQLDELSTPSRRLATRGTELFLASGSEIRCADVRELKARFPKFKVVAEEVARQEHKVLDIPDINFDIRQLEISPDELFLAVVGEKEIGVCVLPGEGALRRGGTSKDALKVKVPSWHRIGRRAFNDQSDGNIVKVLWHPLTVEGGSLLVLSDDGYLR